MSKDQYQGLGLSEEELAALAEDDSPVDEGNLDDDLDDDEDDDSLDDDSDDDLDDDDESGDDEQANDPADKPADKTDDKPADASTDDEAKPDFEPKVAPVEDYDNKIAELNTKEDELSTQFDEGDITQREFRQQIRELDKQRRDIENQQRDFERARAQETQKWEWEVDRFMNDAKDKLGMDYRGNPLLNAALDTAVKQLANDEANDDKPGSWFLEEAHKKVSELLGKPAAPAPKDPVKEALNGRKPDLNKVPKVLADVPAAQNDQPGSSKFDKLDQLSGMDLERALAALPESEARAYLER